MKYISTLLTLVVALSFVGCGGSSENVAETMNIPAWFLDTPTDPNYIFAAATATSRSLGLAVDKAEADSRNKIAQAMETKISGLTKSFQEEVGLGEESELLSQFTQVYKSVVSQTLNGTRATKKEILNEDGVYRAYVLMEMPIGAAAEALMESLKTKENLYTRFRSTQAFQDLDAEVEAYEQFKAEQSGN